MRTMRVMISKERFGRKPSEDGAVCRLQKRDAFVEEELSVEGFAEKVGDGRAWRAGLYGGEGGDSVSARYVRSAPAVALDFDKCPHHPNEIISFSRDVIGHKPNVVYESYSQKSRIENVGKSPLCIESIHEGENPASPETLYSFRVVWVFDGEVDAGTYKVLLTRLVKDVFADFAPDASTTDASRLWFGGTCGAHVVSKKPVPLKAFDRFLNCGPVSEPKEKHPRCDIREREESEYETVCVTSGWQDVLRERCPLFKRLMDGEYLCYSERLTLMSNLKFLGYRSHRKSIKADLLPTVGYGCYRGHTYSEKQLKDMLRRGNGCVPYPCVKTLEGGWVTVPEFFSGHAEEHYAVPNIPKCGVEELDERMGLLPELLASDGFHYIKSQTASGKSEQFVRYVAERVSKTDEKVVYCAPTYANIEEMAERIRVRCKESGTYVEVFALPRNDLSKTDEKLLSLGLPKATTTEGRSSFMRQLYDPDVRGVFLVTHQLVVNLSKLDCSRIVIDENPEDSLVKIQEIRLSALKGLTCHLEGEARECVDLFVDQVNGDDFPCGSIAPTEVLRAAVDELERKVRKAVDGNDFGNRLLSDIPESFFRLRDCECRKVADGAVAVMFKSGIVNHAVLNGIPVKILTATPKHERLRAFYGDVFEEVEIPMAANKGRVVQFMGKSGAKGARCERIPELAGYVRKCLTPEQIENSCVISFKDSMKQWEELGFNVLRHGDGYLHLANNAGLDFLKGKSVIVAGKFDVPDSVYQTESYFIKRCGTRKLNRRNVVVDVCGLKRKMFLLDDPTMRKIQLERILCLTQQAVGRARALREEGARVYVFCDVPIPEADEIHYR